MQRPTRTVVFGVFCLIGGGFLLVHNLQQLSVAIGGPDAIDVESVGRVSGPMGEMLRDTSVALQAAMREPVYRVGLGFKALASSAMACVLFAVGLGLMRDRRWTIRLAKVWAIYAIASAVFITVLQALYVVPNVPAAKDGAAGFQYVSMAFMLLVLCIFPVLLLRQLPTEAVKNYLAYQEAQRGGPPVVDTGSPAPFDRRSPVADDAPPQAPPPPSPPSTGSTWRDDPWNDPGAR
ncbi:MAG: hypothetical protein AAGC44_08030 [Planctomycetota bacterium]